MRAIMTNAPLLGRIGLGQVEDAEPLPHEVVVHVQTISLNQGEIRKALDDAPSGWVPGWDFAGVVQRAARVGAGPAEGDRVVGFLEEGAWKERVAVPARNLAVLPKSVSAAAAATLPVAGLTALHALAEGGLLAGKRVLVNGASGGVGHLALQLARASGAFVVGAVRRESQREHAQADGAHRVVVSDDLSEVLSEKFDLVLEAAGGTALRHALHALAGGGVCVCYGNSTRSETTFDPFSFFFPHGRTRLVGFYLLPTLEREPASEGLDRLARLVADGVLRPRIEVEASWKEVGSVVERFMRREITGKAVLHID